jgi:hypothetical protein
MRLICQRSVSALMASVVFGCTSPTASAGLEATVHFATSVESSCWSLVTPATVYEPVDLPAAFRVEGLKVHVVLSDAPGWATICYVGQLVHVNSIAVQ